MPCLCVTSHVRSRHSSLALVADVIGDAVSLRDLARAVTFRTLAGARRPAATLRGPRRPGGARPLPDRATDGEHQAAERPDEEQQRLGDHRAQAQCAEQDRKSTRLNSSHANISYAVFCLKKKKQPNSIAHIQTIYSH